LEGSVFRVVRVGNLENLVGGGEGGAEKPRINY